MVDRIRTWPTWKVAALFVAPYLVVVGSGAWALQRFEQEDRDDERIAIVEANRDRLDACIGRHDTRVAFQEIILFIVDQPAGVTSDLTQVEGFNSLEPAIQIYLRNLSVALSGEAGEGRTPREQELVDFVADTLPIPDCESLAADLDVRLPDDFVQRHPGS